jgi:hypothetical protein
VRSLERGLATAEQRGVNAEEEIAQLRTALVRKQAALRRVEKQIAGSRRSSGTGPGTDPTPETISEEASSPDETEPYYLGPDSTDDTQPDDDEKDDSLEEEALPQKEGLSYEDYDDEDDFLGPDRAITERRRQLDRERAAHEVELGDETFWMVCPRCGEHLAEHEFDGVKVERCETCGTLSIEKGEIELLMLLAGDDRALAYRTRGLLQ